jgi:hypothetical protein
MRVKKLVTTRMGKAKATDKGEKHKRKEDKLAEGD